MEDLFVPIVSSIVIALLAIFVFKLPSKKKKKQGPAGNPVHAAASGAVQETFDDSVSRVSRAAGGESPADDLAALGNARKRK